MEGMELGFIDGGMLGTELGIMEGDTLGFAEGASLGTELGTILGKYWG